MPRQVAAPVRGGYANPEALVAAAVEDRSPRALARLISLVEDGSPWLREIARLLAPLAGSAQVIGVTGAPGVGKSTSTSALVSALRAQGRRVGVLAVDPSSPFTGGALLGDRVRMTAHTTDPDVYIRSLASRGHLGGLSWATPQALRVLDAAGYDVVLVETVGVGQAEVDIASLADTTLVLLAPGMGDGIQAAKAGILEIADVLVVNKADRPGADDTYRDLTNMVRLSGLTGYGGRNAAVAGDGRWVPTVVRTVAAAGTGVTEVVDAVAAHRAWLEASGELTRRRARRAADEIEQIALAGLRARFGETRGSRHLGALADEVVAGRLDPWTAADDLIAALTGSPEPDR
ncbi:methylmalonyl Co-A mutase-associated GTPase MeaB [Pseudofrankia inefficax]|uniref:methylmalonyl Co-A mutase-associated GTPase MeaB n=1 Tax=Pseudofrankia inefficax (strain DSM 45817 / CECT 9037 / DDB 130130 / EuI1c) TaxID=298654 RepID=UPI0012FDA63A|nr:methylmalonyl Co-A mutase-associated GTPase MeaB [Pseudofrankia inefficax]